MGDELFDYYGRSLRTHDDEACINAMDDALLDGDNCMEKKLPEEFVEILVEYAPILFNTLPREHNLYDTSFRLLELLYEYTGELSASLVAQGYRDLNTTHKKKSDDARVEAFISNIEKVLSMSGGGLAMNEKGIELKRVLEDALEDPEGYILPRLKVSTATTKPIRDYLYSLNLTGKTKHIEAFIRKINESI